MLKSMIVAKHLKVDQSDEVTTDSQLAWGYLPSSGSGQTLLCCAVTRGP